MCKTLLSDFPMVIRRVGDVNISLTSHNDNVSHFYVLAWRAGVEVIQDEFGHERIRTESGREILPDSYTRFSEGDEIAMDDTGAIRYAIKKQDYLRETYGGGNET